MLLKFIAMREEKIILTTAVGRTMVESEEANALE